MTKLLFVSEAIEFRQREFGWTQTRMAKALRLSRGHYSEIMQGKRALPLSGSMLGLQARCASKDSPELQEHQG